MSNANKPYLFTKKTIVVKEYNPDFGDEKVCVCGHKYYRHFDTYENMHPVGCKYCHCDTFVDAAANGDFCAHKQK